MDATDRRGLRSSPSEVTVTSNGDRRQPAGDPGKTYRRDARTGWKACPLPGMYTARGSRTVSGRRSGRKATGLRQAQLAGPLSPRVVRTLSLPKGPGSEFTGLRQQHLGATGRSPLRGLQTTQTWPERV